MGVIHIEAGPVVEHSVDKTRIGIVDRADTDAEAPRVPARRFVIVGPADATAFTCIRVDNEGGRGHGIECLVVDDGYPVLDLGPDDRFDSHA